MIDLETLVEWSRLTENISLPTLIKDGNPTLWNVSVGSNGLELCSRYGEKTWPKTCSTRTLACQEALAKWTEKRRQGYTVLPPPTVSLVHDECVRYPMIIFPVYDKGVEVMAWMNERTHSVEVRCTRNPKEPASPRIDVNVWAALSAVLRPGRVLVGKYMHPILNVYDGCSAETNGLTFIERWNDFSSWMRGHWSLRLHPHVICTNETEKYLHMTVYKSSGINESLERSMI